MFILYSVYVNLEVDVYYEPKQTVRIKIIIYSIYLFLNIYFILVYSLFTILALGIQHSESVIHIHISVLFQILIPFRLLQNILIEFSFKSYLSPLLSNELFEGRIFISLSVVLSTVPD